LHAEYRFFIKKAAKVLVIMKMFRNFAEDKLHLGKIFKQA